MMRIYGRYAVRIIAAIRGKPGMAYIDSNVCTINRSGNWGIDFWMMMR